MNSEKEKDILKEGIRKKFQDEPVFSSADEKIWNNILAEIEQKPRVIKLDFAWWAAAASVSVVLGFYIFYNIRTNNQTNNQIAAETIVPEKLTETEPETEGPVKASKETKPQSPQAPVAGKPLASAEIFYKERLKTNTDKKYDLLEDKSKVTLNSGSVLEVSSDFEKQRNTKLEGEAYFEIEPDKSRPFTIYFGNSRLVVLGTKFNVRSYQQEALREVTVTEGLVKVFPGNDDRGYEVKKGQQLRFSEGEEPVYHEVNTGDYVLWMSENYVFSGTRLSEVAILLSRKFGVPVSVSKEIGKCRYSGDLSGLSAEETLEVLKMSLNLIIKKEKGEIYISGSTCE